MGAGSDEFGGRVREMRTKSGLTQEEVGKAVGVDSSTVGAWERGVAKPHYETMVRLADVLGTSVPELMGRRAVSDLPWDEVQLLDSYRSCGGIERLQLLTYAKQLADSSVSGGEGVV